MLSERFDQALTMARTLHADQVRKGTTIPYLSHPLGVASIALDYGADEDIAIAALLHDTAEDAGGRETLAQIAAEFGERVSAIVEACSDTFENPKPEWRTRKEQYLAHLAEAGSDALLVSAADKLHNSRAILADLRAIGSDLWPRFNGGRDGTLWYYASLVEQYKLSGRVPEPLLRELRLTVEAMHATAG